MGFEVDAFMGVPAAPPPARAEAPRAAPEGPSFDDHLDQASAEPAPVESKPVENKARDKETPVQPDQPAAAPTPAPQPQQQAPVVIQLFADGPPVEDAPVEADASAGTPELAPQTPSAPPPVAPVKADTASKSEAPPPQAETPVAPVEAAQPKADAPAKPDAPVKAEAAKVDAPVVEGAPEAQPQQAQALAPQPEAPPPQLIAQSAPAQTPARVITQPVDTEAASAEIETDAAPEAPKLDTPEDARTAKADADPRADAPKAPAANAKDSFAAFAALAAQDNSPQTQAPAQANAAAMGAAELTSQSGHVTAEHLARAAPAATQVSREIIRRFNGQTTSLELRLDPPELGKVEVRLEVSRDHKVTAVVAAENPAALAELARNARDLQQALQSAGLDLADNGLSFDLKQQRESRADGEGDSSRSNNNSEDHPQSSAPPPSRPIGLESWRGVRVDLVA